MSLLWWLDIIGYVLAVFGLVYWTTYRICPYLKNYWLRNFGAQIVVVAMGPAVLLIRYLVRHWPWK